MQLASDELRVAIGRIMARHFQLLVKAQSLSRATKSKCPGTDMIELDQESSGHSSLSRVPFHLHDVNPRAQNFLCRLPWSYIPRSAVEIFALTYERKTRRRRGAAVPCFK